MVLLTSMVAALPSPPIAAACENSFESNTMSYLIELQTDTGVKKSAEVCRNAFQLYQINCNGDVKKAQ